MYIFTNWRKITCFFEDLSVAEKKAHQALFFSYAVCFLKFYLILNHLQFSQTQEKYYKYTGLGMQKCKHLYEVLPPPIFSGFLTVMG